MDKSVYGDGSGFIKKAFFDKNLADTYASQDDEYFVVENFTYDELYKEELANEQFFQLLHLSITQKFNSRQGIMLQPEIKSDILELNSLHHTKDTSLSFEHKQYGKEHILYKINLKMALTNNNDATGEMIGWEFKLMKLFKSSVEYTLENTDDVINCWLKNELKKY